MMFSGGPSGLIPIITPAMLACKLHQPRTGDAVQLVWAMGYGMTGKLCTKGLAKEYDVDNICYILSLVHNTRTCDSDGSPELK